LQKKRFAPAPNNVWAYLAGGSRPQVPKFAN
jgi:hypothetical protein